MINSFHFNQKALMVLSTIKGGREFSRSPFFNKITNIIVYLDKCH